MGKLIGENITSSTLKGLAIKDENLTLFLLAYIFGMISPKSKIRNVATMTFTKKANSISKK